MRNIFILFFELYRTHFSLVFLLRYTINKQCYYIRKYDINKWELHRNTKGKPETLFQIPKTWFTQHFWCTMRRFVFIFYVMIAAMGPYTPPATHGTFNFHSNCTDRTINISTSSLFAGKCKDDANLSFGLHRGEYLLTLYVNRVGV